MSYSDNPPFERGSTLWEGDTTAISTSEALGLEGKRFTVQDTVHGTGHQVVLQCVRNGTGSAITVVRGEGYEYTAGEVNREVAGLADAGEFGHVIDDAYPVGYSIPDDDLFYVVAEGPVDVRSNAAYSAGDALAIVGTSGEFDTATEGHYVWGIADEAATAGDQLKRMIAGNVNKTLTA